MAQLLKSDKAHTLCLLTASHYLQDLLEEWFVRWDHDLKREQLDTTGTSVPSTLELWHVRGPARAFEELPAELFAANYRAILANALEVE